MKAKLQMRLVAGLAIATGLCGGWLIHQNGGRARIPPGAAVPEDGADTPAPGASEIGSGGRGRGQYQFCRHPEELPPWAVAFGKEFWRHRDSGNLDISEVVERVSHAFTADSITQLPSVRARNYGATLDGRGLRFSPRTPAVVRPPPVPAPVVSPASSTNPDAMENVEFEQQVFAGTIPALPAGQSMPQPDSQTAAIIRTVAIRQGSQGIYDVDQTPLARIVIGNTAQSLLVPALGLIEHYEAGARGIHITWILSRPPLLSGAITVDAELGGLSFAGRSASGLHFADANGIARVGMGDVTVVDSSGKRWPLLLEGNGSGLRVTVLENILAQAAYPLAIDPTVFPEFGMDNLVGAAAPADQKKPAVAANGGTFLIVWEDSRNLPATDVDIFGTRVSTGGAVLDPSGISITTVGGTAPAVGALGTGFLVVWEDSRNASSNGVDIYGSRLTSTGLLLDPSGIPISQGSSDQLAPAVASAGASSLVVWQDARDVVSEVDIYGTIVQNNGTLSHPSGIPITTDSGVQFNPSVAFNGNRYLVAWSDLSGDAISLSGARVTIAGIVSDTKAVPIDTSGTVHMHPSVAAAGPIFLVVWEDYRDAGVTYIDVLGKRINEAGTVLDRSPFPIGTAFGDRFAPVAAGGTTNYLVVWQDGRDLSIRGNDIYGARVSTNGTVIDANGIPMSTALNDQSSPALAFNGTNFFAVWTDARNADSSGLDIFGTLFKAPATVSSTNGTLLSSGAGSERHPSLAANGANYLVVWEDARNTDANGIDLYGVRVNTNGVPLDLNAIPISTAAGDQRAPSVAANGLSPSGTDYLVVWEDYRNATTNGTDIYGTRVSTAGNVLDVGGIPISRVASDQLAPTVASSGAGYLVAWQDARNFANDGLDIVGARVSGGGGVNEINGIPISTAPGNQFSPAVGFAANTYLVVWTDARNQGTTDQDIYGARVNTSGSVLEPSGLPVSRAAGDELAPAVASNGSDFLIVWQDARNLGSTDYDIYGARVTSGGVVTDTTGFAIGAANYAQSLPAVAATGTNLLVVWQDARNSGGSGMDLYGARIVGASVLDPLGFAVNTNVSGQQLPALASGSSRAFLVINQAVRTGAERIVGNIVLLDDAPFITRITRSVSSATLVWTSVTGRTYRVQFRTNINDTSWLDLSGDVLATSNTATKSDTGLGTALRRFYRVFLLP